MIAVILPIHDPRHWPNALAQYERQLHADKCLIVVANGFIDYLPGFERAAAVYASPDKLGVSRACNAGLNIARVKTKADCFARFDCDDLYSPAYLTEVWWGLKHARIVGKSEYSYRNLVTGEGLIVGEGTSGRLGYVGLTGGTLAGYLSEALPFDENFPLAEDAEWVIRMRMLIRGCVPVSTSPFNYVKQFHGEGHTHSVTFQQYKEVVGCL